MVKVAKLKIIFPENVDWKVLNNVMFNFDYVAWKIKNRTVNIYHNFKIKELEYNDENEKRMNSKIRKELYGYSSYSSLIYNEIKEDYTEYGFHSEIIPGLIREAVQSYDKVFLDTLKGKAVIPSFKSGQAIPVRSRQIKMLNRDTLRLSILNKVGGEKYNIKNIGRSYPIDVKIASKNNYANHILENIENSTYSIADSSIKKHKNNIFINLVFKDETEEVEQVAVDQERVLGVFLAEFNAVTMAIANSPKHSFIEGGEIEAFRERIEKQRISKRNQLKYASENRFGHGKETLLKPLDTLSKKVDSFKDLTNHRYSQHIVDYAIKNDCGIIQMEDLKGVNKKDKRLANWSYYDLQQKIKYKAEKLGLKVKIINLKTQCHKCGTVNPDHEVTDGVFKCESCNKKSNVDLNSARNLTFV